MRVVALIICYFLLLSCGGDEPLIEQGTLEIESIRVGSHPITLDPSAANPGIPVNTPITFTFSEPVKSETVDEGIQLYQNDIEIDLEFSYLQENKMVVASHPILAYLNDYQLIITSELSGNSGALSEQLELNFQTRNGELKIEEIKIDDRNLNAPDLLQNINVDFNLVVNFSNQLDGSVDFNEFISLERNGVKHPLQYTLSEDKMMLGITPDGNIDHLLKYTFIIAPELPNLPGLDFDGFEATFYTELDSTYKFPEITNEQLLIKVQEQTFKYFWDFAHPESGLIRERNTSGNLVTIGGSGFGVMTILVGIERGFITRQQGVNRLAKIVDFLAQADRFHGVWPHWMNGTTGEVIPFSANDDGGDIVETAFMIQGLLTARQYLDETDATENTIIDKINQLWEAVEWDWYTQGEDVITWHWSPNFGFEKNLKVRGWNEALIVYVLAASSPTHSVSADVYHQGWARDGAIVNGDSFYGIELPLGSDLGGPLFFEHYSFLGLDPRNLSDQYANYWTQATSHTLINQAYCIANPKQYVGYSSDSWGLTASDNSTGYSAHSPTNDLGVITPTAAISSIPYTPEASMDAIRHFYYLMGDKLWGEYGFHDAFNPTVDWYADSYLAIDQGPIVIMIENYRTGLLWNNFMTAPEIQSGLTKLGFTY